MASGKGGDVLKEAIMISSDDDEAKDNEDPRPVSAPDFQPISRSSADAANGLPEQVIVQCKSSRCAII